MRKSTDEHRSRSIEAAGEWAWLRNRIDLTVTAAEGSRVNRSGGQMLPSSGKVTTGVGGFTAMPISSADTIRVRLMSLWVEVGRQVWVESCRWLNLVRCPRRTS